MDLWEAVGAGRGDVITIIGAGGKTSTLLALAQQGRARGMRALVTTTTRMWLPDLPVVFSDRATELDRSLESAFQMQPVVAAGAGSRQGKLLGLTPETVCALVSADVTLCEADGAVGRSLKIHRLGEPVVPACTTHFIVLAGLDAIGRPLGDAVHPSTLAAAYFRASGNALIQEDHVVGALLEGASFRPRSSSLTFLLNKTEGRRRLEAGRRIAQRVLAESAAAGVLLVSRGHVVQALSEVRH